MKKILVWVVTHRFYRWNSLQQKIKNDHTEITVYYRDYKFEYDLKQYTPDLILSRGRCKTRFPERPEESVGIFYSAREAVREAEKKIPVFPDIFPKFWIWVYRIFFKKTKQ